MKLIIFSILIFSPITLALFRMNKEIEWNPSSSLLALLGLNYEKAMELAKGSKGTPEPFGEEFDMERVARKSNQKPVKLLNFVGTTEHQIAIGYPTELLHSMTTPETMKQIEETKVTLRPKKKQRRRKCTRKPQAAQN